MYLILKLGAESLTCACCLPLSLWVLLIVGRYSAAGWGTYGRVFGTRGSGMKQGYTLKYDSGGVHVELGASVGTLVCCSLSCEAKQNEYLHPHQYFMPLPVYETCGNKRGVEMRLTLVSPLSGMAGFFWTDPLMRLYDGMYRIGIGGAGWVWSRVLFHLMSRTLSICDESL